MPKTRPPYPPQLRARIGGPGGEAIIADELADDRTVLLLAMGTVVLLPRAATGEGHPVAAAVIPQRGVLSQARSGSPSPPG
jgi:hypothetical protein